MTVVSDTTRKARKEHICDYCLGVIKKGVVWRRTFIVDDSAYVWKSHIDCTRIAHKLDMFEGEGINADCFRDHIKERYLRLWPDEAAPVFELQLKRIIKFYL